MRSRRIGLTTTVITAALALAGCSVADDSGPDSTRTSAVDATTGASDAEQESAGQAGIDLANLPEPVATGRIPAIVEGDPQATMDVAFYGLRRSGKVVIATYSFTVNSTDDRERWLYHYLGDQGWHPYLIDSTNLNKHEVLQGSGRAQTEYQGARFRPGQTSYAYAMFAAPPQDVTTMDVAVVDGMPAVAGVEIK